MHFDLDDEQRELQRQVRRFSQDRFALASVRPPAGEPVRFDPSRWAALAELGVFSVLRSEDGMRSIDAALVFEELGRALVPGPLIASAVAGSLLDDVVSGAAIATMIDRSVGPRAMVDHLDIADVAIVVGEDGAWKVDAGQVVAQPVAQPLDPLTPVSIVIDVPAGERLLDAEGVRRVRRSMWLLASAALTGIAAAALDEAVAYTKDRQQFGKAIGTFQAVKHMAADMHAWAELARVATHAAGVLADEASVTDVERAVASARVVAGHAAIHNGKTNIQLHGGMGFTWEADPHLYLKRAWALDALYGSIGRAADAVAETLGR